VWIISRHVEIDSSHIVPKHPGKCRNLHGHRWVFDVECEGSELDEIGFVFDFVIIKELVNRYDHAHLNDFEEFDDETCPPTSENFVRIVYQRLDSALRAHNPTARCRKVRLSETPDSWAEYSE